MRIVRNIALAAAVAGALVLATAATAQDAKKPEAKAEAARGQRGHGMERMREMHGMQRVGEMRGGCHGEPRGAERQEHNHS